jgi:hypothetical protein
MAFITIHNTLRSGGYIEAWATTSGLHITAYDSMGNAKPVDPEVFKNLRDQGFIRSCPTFAAPGYGRYFLA